jgi:hypothetical protein
MAHPFGIDRSGRELLLELPNRRLLGSLSLVDLAARPVQLARAEPSLLVDQEEPPIPDHIQQRGLDVRAPALPVDGGERRVRRVRHRARSGTA